MTRLRERPVWNQEKAIQRVKPGNIDYPETRVLLVEGFIPSRSYTSVIKSSAKTIEFQTESFKLRAWLSLDKPKCSSSDIENMVFFKETNYLMTGLKLSLSKNDTTK